MRGVMLASADDRDARDDAFARASRVTNCVAREGTQLRGTSCDEANFAHVFSMTQWNALASGFRVPMRFVRRWPMGRGRDLTGEVFGRLTVLMALGTRVSASGKTTSWVLARCECGADKEVERSHLLSGDTRSCGCLLREARLTNRLTHGHRRKAVGSATPEYRCWQNMNTRCHNPVGEAFQKYGARGIVVCDRWRESFEAFLADMGERPSSAHSIDRIDANGNYEPGNCRWATLVEQANNKRRTVRITIDGETLPVTEWAARSGVDPSDIRRRLKDYGWAPRHAVFVPVGEKPPTSEAS